MVGVGAKKKLDVADLDEDEKALVKRVRMDRLEVERMKVEEKKAFLRGVEPMVVGKGQEERDVEKGPETSDAGVWEWGSSESNVEFRKRLVGEINCLICKVSRDAQIKKFSRGIAQYNLKNSKTISVAYGEKVKKLLYSEKYEEHHAFLHSFFSEFKQGENIKPGAIVRDWMKKKGLVWTHYC